MSAVLAVVLMVLKIIGMILLALLLLLLLALLLLEDEVPDPEAGPDVYVMEPYRRPAFTAMLRPTALYPVPAQSG